MYLTFVVVVVVQRKIVVSHIQRIGCQLGKVLHTVTGGTFNMPTSYQ